MGTGGAGDGGCFCGTFNSQALTCCLAESSFPPSPARCPPQIPWRPPEQSFAVPSWISPLVIWPFTIVVPGGAGVSALITVPWPFRNLASRPNAEASEHNQPVQITAPSHTVVLGISIPFEEGPEGGNFQLRVYLNPRTPARQLLRRGSECLIKFDENAVNDQCKTPSIGGSKIENRGPQRPTFSILDS
jgi:hypothetical protein